MKWMKDPLAGFISRCGARMGKFTALLVTIAMLAGTTGAGATAFADETVTDGGNVAAESAASQPESTQQSDAENAVGSDVADIAGQDVAGQSATDDDDAQCLTDADEHIMRDRFTFNRKTVMRAARNVAVPQPDWRSCCASANPIRRWRSERASRQATGLVRAGESLSDQRFTRFCCDEYG